jgi:hypothetical protein
MNGTADMTINSSHVGTLTGNFTFAGGVVSAATVNINFSGSSGSQGNQTFTGTVTCNGTSFDAGALSLGGTDNASGAMQAAFNGTNVVENHQSSWTTNGSYAQESVILRIPANHQEAMECSARSPES